MESEAAGIALGTFIAWTNSLCHFNIDPSATIYYLAKLVQSEQLESGQNEVPLSEVFEDEVHTYRKWMFCMLITLAQWWHLDVD